MLTKSKMVFLLFILVPNTFVMKIEKEAKLETFF